MKISQCTSFWNGKLLRGLQIIHDVQFGDVWSKEVLWLDLPSSKSSWLNTSRPKFRSSSEAWSSKWATGINVLLTWKLLFFCLSALSLLSKWTSDDSKSIAGVSLFSLSINSIFCSSSCLNIKKTKYTCNALKLIYNQ